MFSNRLAFAALAVGCLGAAAGGGYFATRQNTVPTPAAAQVQPPATADPVAASPKTTALPLAPSDAPGVSAKATQAPDAAVVETPRKSTASKTISTKQAGPPATGNSASDHRPGTSSIAHRDPAPLMAGGNTAAQPPAPTLPAVESTPTAPHADERTIQEPVRQAEPPAHMFTELVVSADSVIGLQTESRISSETARVEDRVEARVTRDVRVGDRVAIPAGARAIGAVMQVERGGKFKERARLGIRFHTLVLADGTRIPISTETIFREGEAPGNSSASKVGGATVGGAILGAILGGGKGAAIGAAAGAGTGSAVVAAGDRNAATLPAGTAMTVRILQPISITSEQ